jgi:hypothetical protein
MIKLGISILFKGKRTIMVVRSKLLRKIDQLLTMMDSKTAFICQSTGFMYQIELNEYLQVVKETEIVDSEETKHTTQSNPKITQ